MFEKLLEIFKRIPKVECKGHCYESCGPISRIISQREKRFIKAKTGKDISINKKTGMCIFLVNKKCSIYEYRPAICRLYGAVRHERLHCIFGCKVNKILTNEESLEILDEVEE